MRSTQFLNDSSYLFGVAIQSCSIVFKLLCAFLSAFGENLIVSQQNVTCLIILSMANVSWSLDVVLKSVVVSALACVASEHCTQIMM